MKIIGIFILVGVMLFSFVSAADYCAIGEAACSDGKDNDGDESIDFHGSCSEVDCSSFQTAEECESACTGTYTEADADCYSPLDTDEEEEVSYGAPAFAPEEESIFARFWDWLIFWD